MVGLFASEAGELMDVEHVELSAVTNLLDGGFTGLQSEEIASSVE